MSGCCSCNMQEGQSETYIASSKGPDVGSVHPSQVRVSFNTEIDGATSHATGKIHRGLKDHLSTLLNPQSYKHDKYGESTEMKGMGYKRQSSRYDYGFTKDYLSGSIRFVGPDIAHHKCTKSKYMAVHPDEDPEVIINALAKDWKLDFPKLLICSLGGETVTQASKAMEKAFRKGLVEAVLSTDVWLFTGGLNCGLMKGVGQALTNYAIGRAMVKHRDVVAVGVAPLCTLKQKDKLLGLERNPLKYGIEHNNDSEDGNNCSGEAPPCYDLEPNHTHFILVGDEDSTPDIANSLRTKLVNKVAECKIKGSNANVPVLYLLFGGDASCIHSVYDAVIQQKIPVLIIPDSGGAADVLSFAIKKQNIKTSSGTNNFEFDIRLTQEMKLKLDLDHTQHLKTKDKISEIVKRRHLINIYNQELRIDEAILQALMNANRGCKGQDDLHLAVIWNRIDLAKKELLSHKWKNSELKDSFRLALINNQDKFVKLFIDEGNVDMKQIVSKEMLTDLYNQVSESSVLWSLLEEQRKARKEEDKYFTLDDVENLLKKKLIFDTYKHYDEENKSNIYDGKGCFQEPIRELFLWAVLLHRFKLAKLFWKQGKPSIGGALVGCNLLKNLSIINRRDIQESTAMHEHSISFMEMAIELLNLCYLEDRSRTSLLLVRNQPDWGHTTCLELSASARCKELIAHAAVQNLLNELWMGRMSQHTGLLKVWSGIFIPIIPIFMVTYMSKDDPTVPVDKRRFNHQDSEDETVNRVTMASKNHRKSVKECSTYSISGAESIDPESLKAKANHKQPCKRGLSWLLRLKLFHEAPVISFRMNMVAHFLFLGLFSYLLLSDFHEKISIPEMVLIGWVFTLCTEEFRQILQEDFHTLQHRLWAWFWGYWNCIDLVSLVMFAIGVGLRFHPITLDAARIVLALDLIVFYLRILHIFSASKFLGPKLIMIVRMTGDLVTFLAVLLVFMIAFGVACHSILFPNTRDPLSIMKGVLYQSFFHLYGELFLDDSDKECYTSDADIADGLTPCPQHAWFGIVMLALYLFVSNVMLLNLLIAMLNYTFQSIQDNTDTYWKFQRYQLIKEYYQRPCVIPPFIIVIHVYQMFRWAWDRCFPKHKLYRSANLMKKNLHPDKQMEICTWEDVKGEDFLVQRKQVYGDAHKRMKQAEEKLDMLSSRMMKYFDESRLNKALEGRFNKLESQMSNLEQLIKRSHGEDETDEGGNLSHNDHRQALRHHPHQPIPRLISK